MSLADHIPLKRLDRYVLSGFLRNYAVSCIVLIGLYVMMDVFFNFDDFTSSFAGDESGGSLLRAIAAYYGAQALFIYGQLAGVIPVVAAAFTLMRMSRFNELTALLAAGVPLLRVAAPIVITALVINVIFQPLNQEIVIPRMAGWLTLDRSEAVAGSVNSYPVRAMPDGRGGVFDAARFIPADPDAIEGNGATADLVMIIERPTTSSPTTAGVTMLTADRATYDGIAQLWRLEEGRRVSGLITGTEGTAVTSPSMETVDTWDGGITPGEIRLFHASDLSVGAGGSYFDLLSTSQLNELLRRPNRAASADLLRAKHTRIASHVMNLVLMLLAVPAVLTRQPGQLRQAAAKTLIIVGSAMAFVFLCQMLAREPPATLEWAGRWPALMSWLPVFIFGPLSVFLLDRIES